MSPKGPPFDFFCYFATECVIINQKGSPFYIFRHYATFSERNFFFENFEFFSKKMFCAFWALDIAPTWDVPVLFFEIINYIVYSWIYCSVILHPVLQSCLSGDPERLRARCPWLTAVKDRAKAGKHPEETAAPPRPPPRPVPHGGKMGWYVKVVSLSPSLMLQAFELDITHNAMYTQSFAISTWYVADLWKQICLFDVQSCKYRKLNTFCFLLPPDRFHFLSDTDPIKIKSFFEWLEMSFFS